MRCKTCWMFQCLPANKSNKFECTRCLDTQFILNVFKRGTRAQCNRTIEFLEENVEEGVEDKDILKEIEEREARLHRKRLKKRGKENEDQFGEKESMSGNQEEWEEHDELMEDMMMESTDDRTPTTEDSQTDNSPEPSPEDVRDEGFIDGVSVVLSTEARDRIMNIGLTQTSSSVISSNTITSSLPPVSSSSHSSSPSSSSFSPPLVQRYIPIDYSTSGHSVNGKACEEEEPREDYQSGDLDSPHSAKRGRFS